MWQFLFIFTFLSLTFPFAHAQSNEPSPSPSPSPSPTFITESGKPVRMDFHDGRVAVLKVSHIDSPKQIEIPFQVYDNLCNDHRGMLCKYRTDYRRFWYFYVWSQNPDAKKIGLPVMWKNSNTGAFTPYEVNEVASGLESAYLPRLEKGMRPTQIECDDFSWLPTATQQAPVSVHVTRWEAETMTANPETSASENRIFLGALGVDLKRKQSNTMDVANVSQFTQSGRFGTGFRFLVFGDVVTISTLAQNGDVCQIEIKAGSIASAAQQVDEVDKLRPDPKSEKHEYIFGEDEASNEFKNSTLSSSLRQLSSFSGEAQ